MTAAMTLDKIKTDTTWNDAAGSINNNFDKVRLALLGHEPSGKVVIFDATCSSDPWNLNVLHTTTTEDVIREAIENDRPIYAKFANGIIPVGYASITNQGYVDMNIYLVDAEGREVRSIYIYSSEGGVWNWEAFDYNLEGGGGGSIDPELLEGYMPMSRDFSDDFNNDFAR